MCARAHVCMCVHVKDMEIFPVKPSVRREDTRLELGSPGIPPVLLFNKTYI